MDEEKKINDSQKKEEENETFKETIDKIEKGPKGFIIFFIVLLVIIIALVIVLLFL